VILLYHRVTELTTDPQLLAVTPQHFAEQLDVLRRLAVPVKLADLVTGTAAARDAIAVTFDDGYADNLLEAVPRLRQFDTPATVYVATGTLDTRREFFWDELERIFLQPGVLPTELTIESTRFELGADAEYSPYVSERHRNWDATGTGMSHSRPRRPRGSVCTVTCAASSTKCRPTGANPRSASFVGGPASKKRGARRIAP
jgi:peptidoglycan/xylan/chitin deacetylase (PgdA/CDA1 family)